TPILRIISLNSGSPRSRSSSGYRPRFAPAAKTIREKPRYITQEINLGIENALLATGAQTSRLLNCPRSAICKRGRLCSSQRPVRINQLSRSINSSKARKKTFLDNLSIFGPAVRLYSEGRAKRPPENRYRENGEIMPQYLVSGYIPDDFDPSAQ